MLCAGCSPICGSDWSRWHRVLVHILRHLVIGGCSHRNSENQNRRYNLHFPFHSLLLHPFLSSLHSFRHSLLLPLWSLSYHPFYFIPFRVSQETVPWTTARWWENISVRSPSCFISVANSLSYAHCAFIHTSFRHHFQCSYSFCVFQLLSFLPLHHIMNELHDISLIFFSVISSALSQIFVSPLSKSSDQNSFTIRRYSVWLFLRHLYEAVGEMADPRSNLRGT